MSHYYVARFLENVSKGEVLEGDWPEHVSLTPAFEAQETTAVSDVVRLCINGSDISAHIAEKQVWGNEVHTEVLTLTPLEPIRSLHTALCVELVRKAGSKLLDTTWLDENFTPHVSLQPSNPNFTFKYPITFDELALLMFVGNSNHDRWRIEDVIRK